MYFFNLNNFSNFYQINIINNAYDFASELTKYFYIKLEKFYC